MTALVNLNGIISSPEDAKVSVFDRGFLFGDGVYETGRSYDRCVLFLEEHWRRFRYSAERLGLPVPWTNEELTNGLYDTFRKFGKADAYFRTILTRGVIEHVGLDVSLAENKPTLVHILQDLPVGLEERRRNGVKLFTAKTLRNAPGAQDPNIKTSNYLNSLLALQEAKAVGADDAILLDGSGNVTEGTTFSVFGVRANGTLITPALSVGILESLTRRHVIEVAKPFGKVDEGFFKLNEFLDCSETFLVSSIREIFPIHSWDEKKFSLPGKVTEQLAAAYKAHIAKYVETHEKF